MGVPNRPPGNRLLRRGGRRLERISDLPMAPAVAPCSPSLEITVKPSKLKEGGSGTKDTVPYVL